MGGVTTFLREYRDAGVPIGRIERVLAVSRAFLTTTALVAIYLDPNEPARLAALTYGVLLAYALYSGVVLAVVHRTRIRRPHSLALHAFDILWTSALTFVSEGPISPFFLFFLFVVVSAAYRWGFRETLATAVLTVLIFLAESAVVVAGPWHPSWLQEGSFDLNRTILRVTYLLLTGFLLGYLAEQEKQFRAEAAATAAAGRQPRIDLGFTGSVAAVAATLLRTFGARAIALVLRQEDSGRTRVWRLERGTDTLTAGQAQPASELTPAEDAAWLFSDPARAWDAVLSGDADGVIARATEPDVWPLRSVPVELPATVRGPAGTRTVTAINMGLPGEWHGRAYLYDMPREGGVERRLHLLESLTAHVVPALTNVLLMQRLHSEVSAAERARVARELHDGAIQALIGIEMNVQAMRRATPAPAELDRELADIEALLQREVVALRQLMQALRPVEVDAGEPIDAVLAGIVERFRRDSGIAARFVGSDGIRLPPPTALEVVRITQEALMNVRKHSGARNVLVRLARVDGHCELSIEDDGRGFAFAGRLSAGELDARRLGPAVIKERARMLRADLTIDSTPQAGARLALLFQDGAA